MRRLGTSVMTTRPRAGKLAPCASSQGFAPTDGLKEARVRDGLWIVSSNVQRWLGQQPEQLAALEKAVLENPGSIVSRYLLGRAYRKTGQPARTVDVQKRVISDHPLEFRSCVEYALALMDLGELYSACIAVLNMSALYGLSDPRFIATLGGMYFMDIKFSEAERIFAESNRRQFPVTELNRIQFNPRNPNKPGEAPIRLNGKAVLIKAGYAFIESPGYPGFFCPNSQFGGLIIRKGVDVTFEPGFNARGAVARRLSLSTKI